jgi:glucose-6-phosphate isomerase
MGPRLIRDALAPSVTPRLRLSFAANIDEIEIRSILDTANPAETLFIVASKSFSTAETLANAFLARQWLAEALGDEADLSLHLAAISNNTAAARQFGIAQQAIFPIPEWIGGRLSVWSAIGLPLMLAFGTEVFGEFLAGGRSMDAHFANAPFASNLPVLMALLGIWNATFLEIDSHAVLPYSHRLRKLPAYLQQLEMESNGKSVDRNGQPVRWQTAPILFGGPGTLGQHAYHQLFYQGTRQVSIDFVLPVESDLPPPARSMVGNALAQSAALMLGRTLDDAQRDLVAKGLPDGEVARLAPHLVCAGNQPSSTLLMPPVNAFSLGQLLALHEHKVFVQGWIWGINSFDQ